MDQVPTCRDGFTPILIPDELLDSAFGLNPPFYEGALSSPLVGVQRVLFYALRFGEAGVLLSDLLNLLRLSPCFPQVHRIGGYYPPEAPEGLLWNRSHLCNSLAGFIMGPGNRCPGLPSIRVGPRPNTPFCIRLMATAKPPAKNTPSTVTVSPKG